MKIFILSIVALCVFYLGYLISKFLLKQYQIYGELVKFCELLINQIKFTKNPVKKIVSDNINMFNSEFKNILTDYFINDKKNVKTIYLISSDEDEILKFFNSIGKLDVLGEVCNIENNKTLFNLKFNEKKEKNIKYGTLSKKLGALFGILLFIIFL